VCLTALSMPSHAIGIGLVAFNVSHASRRLHFLTSVPGKSIEAYC